MKIRIFALAKELGLDSKVLIDHANDAGVVVKNSALASISPEERDTILQHLEALKASPAPTETVPVPEMPRETTGKVRTIKTRAPKQTAPVVETAVEVEAEKPAEVAVEDTEAEPVPVAEETVTEEADQEQPAAAEVQESDQESDDTETAEDAESDGPSPMLPSDYVPPTGVAGGAIREMKPRGTVPGATPKRPKTKPRPQLPNIAAAPSYVPPKVKVQKTEEAPAQKPDIPLTAEALKGGHSPLRDHLKQNRKRVPDSPGQGGGGKRSGKMIVEEGEQEARRKSMPRRRSQHQQDDFAERRRRRPTRRRQRTTPIELKTEAEIELPITIRSLSEATGRPARVYQTSLFQQGNAATINDVIDEDTAIELAMEAGVDLTIKRGRDIEEELRTLQDETGSEEELVPRPPIVTILGHVDHGKTSLIDKIRSANVADGEAGGITQHIASYQITHGGKQVTFVDTPGHAAFGEMRARGASVTDIVVLVVAADDGVMPQTVECISHAKAAGVPIVVAMNKIDRPDANEQKVLQDLANRDVLPAEWGGDVEVVRTSAMTGDGIDDLLETILLTAELQEYQADPNQSAVGVCLEAFMDEGRGVIAWLIIQKGTLRVGDIVLCGPAYGRIRAIYNDRDQEIDEAGPSLPVRITGLDIVPGAGDHFYVMSELEEARLVAGERQFRGRTQALAGKTAPRSFEDILSDARGGTVQDLPLIVKADTPGSLEALRSELTKLDHPEVRVQIIHEAVGGVNESDVSLASASNAIIIAFHVIPEDRAAELAQHEGVEIRRYRIIYEVTEQIRLALEGMLEPDRVEVMTGRALVLQTFKVSRFGTIAGCRILSGTIDRNNRVHVIRDQTVINDYNIASLRREKDDVREVREGMECGIRLEGFNDVKEGDLMEAFRIDQVKRKLE